MEKPNLETRSESQRVTGPSLSGRGQRGTGTDSHRLTHGWKESTEGKS